jgi:hypothetical protein
MSGGSCRSPNRTQGLIAIWGLNPGTLDPKREVIFDKSPKWNCPLDESCVGGGAFQDGRRESLVDGEDRFCVTFTNRAPVPQDVGVNFHSAK